MSKAPERIWMDDTGVIWRNGIDPKVDVQYVRADIYENLKSEMTDQHDRYNDHIKELKKDRDSEIDRLMDQSDLLFIKNKDLNSHIKELETEIKTLKYNNEYH